MCASPNRCIRFDKPKRGRGADKSQYKLNQKVAGKVLCQKDYLQVVCSFMKMNDILQTISLLSRFHCDFFKTSNNQG